MPLKAAEEIVGDKNSRWSCRSSWFITVLADLKSAGHNCCTTAVQMVSGTLQNTPKRLSITLIPQQHTQNWIDS
jgi:hypothetical protein